MPAFFANLAVSRSPHTHITHITVNPEKDKLNSLNRFFSEKFLITDVNLNAFEIIETDRPYSPTEIKCSLAFASAFEGLG